LCWTNDTRYAYVEKASYRLSGVFGAEPTTFGAHAMYSLSTAGLIGDRSAQPKFLLDLRLHEISSRWGRRRAKQKGGDLLCRKSTLNKTIKLLIPSWSRRDSRTCAWKTASTTCFGSHPHCKQTLPPCCRTPPSTGGSTDGKSLAPSCFRGWKRNH